MALEWHKAGKMFSIKSPSVHCINNGYEVICSKRLNYLGTINIVCPSSFDLFYSYEEW